MDDDDKVRRNLIASSAIIIAVAWFDLSLPDLLERLFSIKGDPNAPTRISDWKVWVAALIAISYMAWRYRWSDEVADAKLKLQLATGVQYAALYEQNYLRSVAEWIRTGDFPEDAHPQVNEHSETILDESGRRALGIPNRVVITTSSEAQATNGNEAVHVAIFFKDASSASSMMNLYIDAHRQRRMSRKALALALVNSKASMSLTWPVLMAGAAVAIVLYKLVRLI